MVDAVASRVPPRPRSRDLRVVLRWLIVVLFQEGDRLAASVWYWACELRGSADIPAYFDRSSLLALALLGACQPAQAFECTKAADCSLGGLEGTCAPTGRCAYPDDAAASGYAYPQGAGPSLAGVCFHHGGRYRHGRARNRDVRSHFARWLDHGLRSFRHRLTETARKSTRTPFRGTNRPLSS